VTETHNHSQPNTNIGTYARVTCSSQESNRGNLNSISQHSSSSFLDDSTYEPHRSHARFQEFVARSRHLEIMDCLHDVKTRVVALEEKVELQNQKVGEGMTALSKQNGRNTDALLHTIGKFHEYETQMVKAVENNLHDCRGDLGAWQAILQPALKQLALSNQFYEKLPNNHTTNCVTSTSNRFGGDSTDDSLSDNEVTLMQYLQNKRHNHTEHATADAVDPNFNPLAFTQYGPDTQSDFSDEESFDVNSFMSTAIDY
jgi:hypothetical protein